MGESVSLGGLSEAGFARGADLDGVLVAKKEVLRLAMRVELSKLLRDKVGMTKPSFANMFRNSRERNDDCWMVGGGKAGVENFGEGASESAGGIKLKVVNEFADEVRTMTDNKNGWEMTAF